LIPVTDLRLDENNPRLDNIKDQNDALKQIVENQGEKLVRLAQDIIEVGATNPSELPIVIPSNKEQGKFITLEGNRRLTVLKLFLDESLFGLIENQTLKKQLQKIQLTFLNAPITSLQCYVANTIKEAEHWRLLRHTGENKGVGTVPWDAAAIAKFTGQFGITTYNTKAIQVVKLLKTSPAASSSAKSKLDELSITNLARLINDPDVRKELNLKVNKQVVDENQKKDTIKKLETIVNEITTKDFSVRQIDSKSDRQEFIGQLFGSSGTTSPQDKDSDEKSTTKDKSPDTGSKSSKSKPESTKRTALIPSNTILKIEHPRLNKIYRELKSLKVDDYENSVAVMFRVFVELSIDEYSVNIKIPGYSKNSELKIKIRAVADFMEKNKILEKDQLKAIRVSISNPHDLFSANTLNAYVHNRNFEPKSKDLKLTWNNIQLFITKLWE